VKRIGLIGGIGAGKSTVQRWLVEHGYFVIDADDCAREILQPDARGFSAVVDAFGHGVLSDGVIDRPFLASVAFGRAENRLRLNAITHPLIGELMRHSLETATGTAAFCAIPLFRASHREELGLDAVWNIAVSPEISLQRLVDGRGMSLDDAQARLLSQPTNAERAQLADITIWNDHSESELLSAFSALVRDRGL